MTQKQKLFCEYYAKTNDLQLAIEKSGYKYSTAKCLLKKTEVQQYIEKILKSEKIADCDEVLEFFSKIMRGDDKLDIDKKSITIKDRIKAAELLGKVYCIFSSKSDSNTEDSVIILGDEELEN